jgi:hypothetical protein
MMSNVETVRVRDFTTLPGPRYRTEGPFSGQQFREEHLAPAFRRALQSEQPLVVDLDGMRFGYPASFLEESFGGLARMWTDPVQVQQTITHDQLLQRLTLVSNDQPSLVAIVQRYIRDSNRK